MVGVYEAWWWRLKVRSVTQDTWLEEVMQGRRGGEGRRREKEMHRRKGDEDIKDR